MSNPVILEETPVSLNQVKEALVANQKQGELNFRANKTLEYVNQVPVAKKKEAEKLFAELQKLEIPRMKDMHTHKLVDTRPATLEELKGILSAYTLTVSKENLDKILEVLNKS